MGKRHEKPQVVRLGGNMQMSAGVNPAPQQTTLRRKLWQAILAAIGINRS